jgi:hypothetical protein
MLCLSIPGHNVESLKSTVGSAAASTFANRGGSAKLNSRIGGKFSSQPV